jgi:hypothetical protein
MSKNLRNEIIKNILLICDEHGSVDALKNKMGIYLYDVKMYLNHRNEEELTIILSDTIKILRYKNKLKATGTIIKFSVCNVQYVYNSEYNPVLQAYGYANTSDNSQININFPKTEIIKIQYSISSLDILISSSLEYGKDNITIDLTNTTLCSGNLTIMDVLEFMRNIQRYYMYNINILRYNVIFNMKDLTKCISLLPESSNNSLDYTNKILLMNYIILRIITEIGKELISNKDKYYSKYGDQYMNFCRNLYTDDIADRIRSNTTFFKVTDVNASDIYVMNRMHNVYKLVTDKVLKADKLLSRIEIEQVPYDEFRGTCLRLKLTENPELTIK